MLSYKQLVSRGKTGRRQEQPSWLLGSFHSAVDMLSLTQSNRQLCVWFLFCMLSNSRQSLGFYPTFMLTKQPVTVSWMLTEDMRLLGQKQRLYYSWQKHEPELHLFVSTSHAPQIPQQKHKGLIWMPVYAVGHTVQGKCWTWGNHHFYS